MRKLLAVIVVGLGVLTLAGVAMAENTLEVLPEAAMNGTNYGLKVNIDQGSLDEAYVQSDHPQTESHFRVGFWLDATGLSLPVTPPVNKKFVFMKLYSDSQTKQHTFVYIMRNNEDTAWRIGLNTKRDNNTFFWVGGTFLSNSNSPNPHYIEVEWQQADPGMSNGYARLYRDGVLKREVTDLDNDTWNVDRVRVGIPPLPRLGPLASGYFYFDEYVSTR
ncbi:MAG TPA: hypothetical protein PKJ99_03245 [Thermoanaerobaculales bacterium]|nr:hypothetical protein [Thermoanaerobaculales bacterium]HPA80975.1 hypothetical protein [Thermoanaerobaculales bacterium]HQL29960.1 hypothetical protein [Thermoanaerobaculales bacterium]HQN94917.1 hypothetical protein [Thermoanaerobaculales bacterium]HQP44291.1 hypothetical protein [Thermoanaerobaculales bacterium]